MHNNDPKHTVLLVCGREDVAEAILDRLYQAGIAVVGPAATARLALMLAAQTPPTIALVASPPTGRRDAAALGEELMTNWGVRSWVLDEAHDGTDDLAAQPWSADPRRLERLRRALQPAPCAAP